MKMRLLKNAWGNWIPHTMRIKETHIGSLHIGNSFVIFWRWWALDISW